MNNLTYYGALFYFILMTHNSEDRMFYAISNCHCYISNWGYVPVVFYVESFVLGILGY
jgi:hypothetical protein